MFKNVHVHTSQVFYPATRVKVLKAAIIFAGEAIISREC